MMRGNNPTGLNASTTGHIVHEWTTQDGTRRVMVKTSDGQHYTASMPFSADTYEGRRVSLVDGRWVLATARAA